MTIQSATNDQKRNVVCAVQLFLSD
jgi:hypothetical protein